MNLGKTFQGQGRVSAREVCVNMVTASVLLNV